VVDPFEKGLKEEMLSVEVQMVLGAATVVMCSLAGVLLGRLIVLSTWKKTVALMKQPRRVEVRVLPPEEDPRIRTEFAGQQGWFVVWYESSKGWMLADVFVGEGAFRSACAEAAKLCAIREEGLRFEVARFQAQHPDEDLPLKPRDYLVLPAVVFRAMGRT
jgi:hypothetical protein